MSADTLSTLIAISRSKPVERSLCCPDCGSDVELRNGFYVCVYGRRLFTTLAELAVRKEAPRG